MTQPATGDVWPSLYGFNNANLRKALYGSILIRDADGANTSLAFTETDGEWADGFTPFAADGQFRTDLLVPSGTWHDLGAGSSDGPSFANKVDIQKDHIWQTRQVVRSDITSEEGMVTFGMAEQSPLADALEFDLPLENLPTVGADKYARKRPNEMEGRIRQILAIGVDKNETYFVDVFPSVSFESVDDRKWSPEELIVLGLTWSVTIDPHSGYSHARFRAGKGWTSSAPAAPFKAAPRRVEKPASSA